jgi:hypothetical protein
MNLIPYSKIRRFANERKIFHDLNHLKLFLKLARQRAISNL